MQGSFSNVIIPSFSMLKSFHSAAFPYKSNGSGLQTPDDDAIRPTPRPCLNIRTQGDSKKPNSIHRAAPDPPPQKKTTPYCYEFCFYSHSTGLVTALHLSSSSMYLSCLLFRKASYRSCTNYVTALSIPIPNHPILLNQCYQSIVF